MLPYVCGRATLDARRLLLFISGVLVEILVLRCAETSGTLGGFARANRWGLARPRRDAMVLLCPLKETRLASAECATLKIGGYQHVEQVRTPHGATATILLREEVGVEVGVLDRQVPERATVALRSSVNLSLAIASARFHRKADFSSESLDTLLGAGGPLVVGADVN
ncbi:hypothetical protein ERJ75_001592400 [Trypanosoma vivax]|nr:hypothetical protein TRVL_10012 [Trypanosoma vivax]KAH8605833.1 hypothetical protein ERJ75_001592400 [Trypanosoma vivax]